MKKLSIAVVGGGAAGFFAAIQCKLHQPDCRVTIFEKTTKVLSKVKVSGGGRCNVTNKETSISKLARAYPRGEREIKKLLHAFSTTDIVEFFQQRGVKLYAQDDGRVFPESDQSETIINCFLEECEKREITITTQHVFETITPQPNGRLLLEFNRLKEEFDRLILCTGGNSKSEHYDLIENQCQPIISPLPSLFTFNMPQEEIKKLAGLSVEKCKVKIEGEKLITSGPVLITHWGMSGPAILKLSAYGARLLAKRNYDFNVLINWVGGENDEKVKEELMFTLQKHENTQIKNIKFFDLPKRLVEYLIEKNKISPEKKAFELGKKEINKLTNTFCNDRYHVAGKTTFKEEFVTAGGVDLKGVDIQTMESKYLPKVYFAGEVLDIDGITGGYNFQSAWTTAYVAAKSAVR